MSQNKAQLESALSLLISYIKAKRPDVEVDADARITLRRQLEEIVADHNPDLTSWPYVRKDFFYDVYLAGRREERTLTPFDLIRPGLTKALFAEEAEYYNHMMRISAARHSTNSDMKECSVCRATKPVAAFKKKGGAKCNSCRSKEYRDRKAALAGQGEQE